MLQLLHYSKKQGALCGEFMNMPFGKYKGYPVENLPFDYVLWLSENCQLREPLKTNIRLRLWKEEERREQQERVAIMHYDGGMPEQEAIEKEMKQ